MVCSVSGKEMRITPIFTDLPQAYSFISVFAMPLKPLARTLTKLNSKMKLEKTSGTKYEVVECISMNEKPIKFTPTKN